MVAPLVSLFLMSGARARGRLGLASIMRCVSIASAIVVLYYGAEEWITAGRMSRSIVVAAGSVGKVHPANWFVGRQSSSGTHLEMRGPDSAAGGRRPGDGIGPAARRHGGRS